MSSEMILAISSLITAVLAGFGAWRSTQIAANSARSAARRDEVALLREEVVRLHARVRELEGEMRALERENAWLRKCIREYGLDVPPIPDDFYDVKGGEPR